MLLFDSKSLPDQTYNDTVAMAIGRKLIFHPSFDLFLDAVVG